MSTYSNAVVALSPLSYWRLGEPSGTTAVDVRGVQNGTYYGSPTLGATGLISGDADTAMVSDTNKNMHAPCNLLAGDFTIAVWVKSNSGTAPQIAAGKYNGAGVDYWLGSSSGTTLSLAGNAAHSTTACNDNAPHLIVGVRASNVLYVYVDGVVGGTTAGYSGTTEPGGDLTFGAYGNETYPWYGTLDEPAVWTSALTQPQIAALYAAGVPSNVTCTPSAASLALTGAVPVVIATAATPPVFPPVATLEVQVWSPDSETMLAILDGASNVRWTDILGDVGSGSCQLSIYDPKYTPGIVQKGNLVKFVLNGTTAFAFFNTAPKLTVGEANSSVITLAGNSVLDYLGRALAYPPGGVAAPTAASRSWTGATAGSILKTLIDAAHLRGTGLSTLGVMATDFDDTYDSAHTAWTANINLTVDAKATILDVAKKLVAMSACQIFMDPRSDPLTFHAYVPGGLGANLTSSVIFQQGRHFTGPVDNAGSMPTTVALVAGSGGTFVERTDANYTENPAYGRIETALDYSTVTGNTTQMNAAGDAQIALSEAAGQAITIKLNHGTDAGSFEPYSSYHLGDTIAINVPGSYSNAPSQIVGLTIAQTPGAGYTVEVNLGAIALPIDLRLARMMAATSGTTSNVSGGVAGNLTLCNPRGFPSGSAFPLNPTDGMWWFRPDLGEAYQYVAAVTKWLSTTIYTSTPVLNNATVPPWSVNSDLAMAWPVNTVGTARGVYIVGWASTTYVAAPNSGVSYWTVTLAYDGGAISQFTTAADTAATQTSHVNAVGAAYAAGTTRLYLNITRTGTPGNLYAQTFVEYRKVAT